MGHQLKSSIHFFKLLTQTNRETQNLSLSFSNELQLPGYEIGLQLLAAYTEKL